MNKAGRTHLVIPDTQAKAGVPTEHLVWIGRYIVDTRPDVVVHLGDHWDMPSLSSYDRGKTSFEGRRYAIDVQAGNEAMAKLTGPLDELNARKRRNGKRQYKPELHLLRGNHEDRIRRAVEDDSRLDGTIGLKDLESPGWATHDFLEIVWVDGVAYSHYFYRPNSGRPYSGMIETRLRNVGHSFTQGHEQTLGYAIIHGAGYVRQGLVAGACYLHDEEYKGPQGNDHWRGIIVKHEVQAGRYDPMFVSLDYLCRRYEGVSLATFMKETR